MGFREVEDSEALWEVLLCPGCQLRLVALPTLHNGLQALLSVVFGVPVEDRFDLGSNGSFQALFALLPS